MLACRVDYNSGSEVMMVAGQEGPKTCLCVGYEIGETRMSSIRDISDRGFYE